MTKMLTNWTADREGFFQGTPTAGEALDKVLGLFRKRKVPRAEALADAWPSWPKGDDFHIDDAWLAAKKKDGELPGVYYQSKNSDGIDLLLAAGTHVVVEMLDPPPAKRRRTVFLRGGVLIARSAEWNASLKNR